MKWLFIISILMTTSCSTWMGKDTKFISRTISNNDFYNMSSMDRLNEIDAHIDETIKTLSPKGNPRYYIFETFRKRSSSLFQEIRKYESDLKKKEFVPANPKIIDLFRQFVASHKIMSEAGIYIVSSRIVEPDTQETSDLLFSLRQVVMMYEDEIKAKSGGIWKPELTENAESYERLLMIQSLSSRINEHFETFVTYRNDQKIVRDTLKNIKRLSFKDREQIKSEYSRLRKSNSFKKVSSLLSNLNLPDSGEIDGHEEAFEQVMSVQFSNELINFLTSKELRI